MIEVFKTNVTNEEYASMLVNMIHQNFTGYTANFDLQDCDKILRIVNTTGSVRAGAVINFLKGFGFNAEILPDEIVLATQPLAAGYSQTKN
ncbi:MAG TPA: hypothetical protein VFV68_00070 [Agriterribacter sp.]|nr:hypothetical protein [Agriterribacter sp.]